MTSEISAFLKILKENNKTRRITYDKGSIVLSAGYFPEGVSYIESGEILQLKGYKTHFPNDKIISEGSVLGIDLILNDLRYNFSAVALSDVDLIFLPKAEFKKIVRDSHYNRILIMKLLCSDINNVEVKIKEYQ